MSLAEVSADHDLLLVSLIILVSAPLTLWCLLRSIGALVKRRPGATLSYGMVSLIGLAVVAVLMLVVSNLYIYQRLSHEQQVARLVFARVDDRHYRALLEEPGGKKREFDLAGDEWQLDARVLKWRAWAQLLGLQTRYRLARIQGRYRDLAMEKSARRSVYDLTPGDTLDLWAWLQSTQFPWHFADALYGSSTYLPMVDGGAYTVNLSGSGLVARADNDVARKAIRDW